MSLLNVQNFLARLYTDENLRREFARAPKEIGTANELNAEEIAELAEILPAELDFFADSLRWKRSREVEKLLPFTKKALAVEFENYFREFAAQFTPVSIKKHLEDAIHFTDFLQNGNLTPVWIKDVARFEQAKLEFYGYGKSFVIKKFDYDVKELSLDKSEPLKELRRKRIVVWLRFGRQTRFYTW
jgi:hypothetical protein